MTGGAVDDTDIDLLDRDLYQNGPFETLSWIRANRPVFRRR
ncbi:MAG: hypothetical protein ACKOYO_05950 [Actinomycetota bacterium]